MSSKHGGIDLTRNLHRHPFQRVLGIPATHRPVDPECWTHGNGRVLIDLRRAPDLTRPEGAIRLSGKGLPLPLLVFRDEHDVYRAYVNRCGHHGRCLDPVYGAGTVQCCGLGRSTFDHQGRVVSGPASRPVVPCRTRMAHGRLVVYTHAQARVGESHLTLSQLRVGAMVIP